mmetsp:Transcript_10156/g.11159  ORF Transcript_10156/g.11159 Transcript_10156/m.11159 type:complete len:85 (-) Transcript_10156:216-470(-)
MGTNIKCRKLTPGHTMQYTFMVGITSARQRSQTRLRLPNLIISYMDKFTGSHMKGVCTKQSAASFFKTVFVHVPAPINAVKATL